MQQGRPMQQGAPGQPSFQQPPPAFGPSGSAPNPGYIPGQHQNYGPGNYAPPSHPPGHQFGFDARPETELVKPLRAPQYLASDSLARAATPTDPWGETTKTLLLVYGVLLIACFVAPWAVGVETVFSWTLLKAPSFAAKLLPLLIMGTGVGAIALGTIPMAGSVRGIAAAILGGLPIIALTVVPNFKWQALLGGMGAALIVVGLLLRSQYTTSMLGRLVASIGVVIILALYLIPAAGNVPIIGLFKALGQQPVQHHIILGQGLGGGLVPLVLTLLALLVWLPGPGNAGTGVLAWVIILYGVVAPIALLLLGGNIGPTLKAALAPIIYRPVAASGWLAFAGYGGSMILGKSLEAPPQ